MLAAATQHTATSGIAMGLIVFIVVGVVALLLAAAATRRK